MREDAARLAAVVASVGFNESDLRRGKPALTGERLDFLFDPSVVGAPARAVLHWMASSRRVTEVGSLARRSTDCAELAALRRARAEGTLLRGAELRAACRAARVSLAPPPPPSGDGSAVSSGRGESGSQSQFEAFVASKGADEGTAQSEAARRRSDAVADSVDVLCAFAKGNEDVAIGIGRRRLLDPRAEALDDVEAQIAELERRVAPAQAHYDGLAARVAMMAECIDAAAVAEAAARSGGGSSDGAAAKEATALAALRCDAERAFADAGAMGAEEEAAVEELAAAMRELLEGSDGVVGERVARLSQPMLADAHASYAKRERQFTKALGAFLKKAFDRRLTGRARGVSAAAPALLRDRLIAAAALAETPAQLAAAKEDADELRRLEAAMASALRHRAAAAAHAARRRARAAALSARDRIPHDDPATLDHLITLDAGEFLYANPAHSLTCSP